MNLGIKKIGIFGAGIISLSGLLLSSASAQAVAEALMPEMEEMTEEVYVLREPTKEELKRYAINAEIDELWDRIFDNSGNWLLRQQIAKKYILLGNADIALHELKRAEQLGMPRNLLLGDIGKTYLITKQYDLIGEEILIEEAAPEIHGEVYLVQGLMHNALGQKRQAFLKLYQASIYLPDQYDLNASLASLYNDMGEYEKAELNVDKALNFEPRKAEILLLKGELVQRRAGSEKSLKYFELANFYEPENTETESKLAGAYFNLRNHDESMKWARKILARDQRNPYANFMVAALFAEGNNIRTATRYLNQAGFNAYLNSVPALLLWGKLGYATGDYDRSVRSLSRLKEIDPLHIEASRILAASNLKLGNGMGAVDALLDLNENGLMTGLDYYLIGSAYSLVREYDNAALFMDKAVTDGVSALSAADNQYADEFGREQNFGITIDFAEILNQNNADDYRLVIEAYQALEDNDFESAFDSAARLIDANRQNPLGYYLIGRSYQGQGQADDARSNFSRALQLDRNFHQARLALAKIQFERGNENDAVLSLNTILSRDEEYLPAYDLLYEFAMMQGDFIRAERYLRTATSARADLMEPRLKLINFYFDRGNVNGARNNAFRLTEIFPDHYLSHKMAGKSLLLGGNAEQSLTFLEQSIAKNASDQETFLLLARAYMQTSEMHKVRPLLVSGLETVKDRLPLVLELVELTKTDRNFQSGYHYIDQLKLDETTIAVAYLYQGELNLLENRVDDAMNAFNKAKDAGATEEQIASVRNNMPIVGLQVN
ncbi:tetratricopeptide repeat protein [Pseudemcibacter aquimaris]|uniref:tetratricopeptide repeat protein n=1 Tax=Pseudemcibacter aquimaris TaxID=2857064 RepID=UPI002013089D|nr:tetratricopeptide repeat protein [Pseudemcibacter aquimaris]MCC3860143.1 tetratricopeptide repeat protein [Pseudemcibacter aquimaris]WDU57470.1 tetratricopeptide repeat protein [Pseudemcibacter aquimaris]